MSYTNLEEMFRCIDDWKPNAQVSGLVFCLLKVVVTFHHRSFPKGRCKLANQSSSNSKRKDFISK